jgi:hypothetical protein
VAGGGPATTETIGDQAVEVRRVDDSLVDELDGLAQQRELQPVDDESRDITHADRLSPEGADGDHLIGHRWIGAAPAMSSTIEKADGG